MSFILRHHPEEIGLELDRQGWASVTDLVKKSRAAGRTLSRDLIRRVLAGSNKSRFELSDDGQYIRAGYGHSIPVNVSLNPESPPRILYHGTAHKQLESILDEGLLAGSRNYVHLTSRRTDALHIGHRHGNPVVLLVRAARMYTEGYPCYRSPSESSIWLTERVPPRYLSTENVDE